ncbi:MAG TPA: hypothetical protein P5084_15830 [Paludibacter sp.]|nr:hypothetical protein [Paludibacter sp.]
MDLSNYRIQSWTDPTWMNNYITSMGESKFWHFADKIYKTLNSLNVGESMEIDPGWDPTNIDFYVKVSCCYVSESAGCYSFNADFTKVKKNFDRKTIEKQMAQMNKKRIQYQQEVNITEV